ANSPDPVERQSSRITCVIAYVGTADLAHHFAMCMKTGPGGKPAVGRDYMAQKLGELFGLGPEHVGTPEADKRLREMSPTSFLHKDCPPTMLAHRGPADATSKDDPRLEWNVHTAKNGFILAERLRDVGVPCRLVLFGSPDPDRVKREIEFLKRYNGMQ
ncbi:MAG: alpha/beta hydrolase family protein, partial [Planctomycetota bacterium]